MPVSLETLIGRQLPPCVVPGVPEIRLHLAQSTSGLGRLLAQTGSEAPPYWAHLWAGGLVLARYLLDEPAIVAGRRVLDLGSGSGLVAIAAARAGAGAVRAVDIDPLAVAASTLNAALNGVTLTTACLDALDHPSAQADLILVGDLFYQHGLAERVGAFLDRCSLAGTAVLVGDPGRPTLPLDHLLPIRTTPTVDFGTGHDRVRSTVYAYRGRPDRDLVNRAGAAVPER